MPWLQRGACTRWLPGFSLNAFSPGVAPGGSQGRAICRVLVRGPARAPGSPVWVQRGAALPVLRSPVSLGDVLCGHQATASEEAVSL